jgi:hypothetical protein
MLGLAEATGGQADGNLSPVWQPPTPIEDAPLAGEAAGGRAFVGVSGVLVVRLFPPNEADPEHLAEVVRDLRRLGSPVLRAVRVPGGWALLEGSHRVVAAKKLGVSVTLRTTDPAVVVADHGWADANNLYDLRVLPAGELVAFRQGPEVSLWRWRVRVC